MNEKRFIRNIVGNIYDSEKDKWFEEDWKGKPLDYEDDLIAFLNEQQATIDEQKIIIEERDVANERLNRFLIEIGLEKEYIKWEFKKRCVE